MVKSTTCNTTMITTNAGHKLPIVSCTLSLAWWQEKNKDQTTIVRITEIAHVGALRKTIDTDRQPTHELCLLPQTHTYIYIYIYMYTNTNNDANLSMELIRVPNAVPRRRHAQWLTIALSGATLHKNVLHIASPRSPNCNTQTTSNIPLAMET